MKLVRAVNMLKHKFTSSSYCSVCEILSCKKCKCNVNVRYI